MTDQWVVFTQKWPPRLSWRRLPGRTVARAKRLGWSGMAVPTAGRRDLALLLSRWRVRAVLVRWDPALHPFENGVLRQLVEE